MSMPPLVKWSYDWAPEKNSLESKLYDSFLIKKRLGLAIYDKKSS